ncbi:MAG: L-seryl-tRNA(Sec) selenium transferase [Candidatus Sericytochromatia bacterium]
MTDRSPQQALRSLPAVGALLEHPALKPHRARFDHAEISQAIREAIALERQRRLAGEEAADADTLAASALERLEALFKPRLRRVVNATGVVINTNLGRSPLPPAAMERLIDAASGYSNLEIDLATGSRGSRYSHVEGLITRLTGAEAALVVNNCAAAVLLLTDTFARGREVVVSRGQLIEIGGSFRLPEVLTASGARLVEVGTTNKTYLSDYERAITPETGMLMLSHTSNYRIIGFTAEVDRSELAALGREHGVVTVEDLGSGLLVDLTRWGVPSEPTVQESVASGVDLVAVSGDKLLGGPQAGIIVGKKPLVDKLKKNPMLRALRQDKMALAALEGTLKLYLQPDRIAEEVPIMGMMALRLDVLKGEANRLAERLAPDDRVAVRVIEGQSSIGGGTLPGVELATWLVALRPKALSVVELARRMRTGEPAVVGRIHEDQLLLDPRTLLPGDHERIETAMKGALA